MINVSDFTKKVYSEYNVPKYLTVSFPNDNIPDITNENIYGESMKLTQSICEDNELTFGGCNAAQFELTVMDIQQELLDKNIRVTMSCKDPNFKNDYVNGMAYKENDVVIQDGNYCRFNTDWGTTLLVNHYHQDASKVIFESGTIKCEDYSRLYIKNSNLDDLTITLYEGLVPPPRIEDDILICSNNLSSIENDILEFDLMPSIEDEELVFPVYFEYSIITGPYENDYLVIDVPDNVYEFQIKLSANIGDEDILLQSTICLTNRFEDVSDYWSKDYGYIDTSNTDDITLFQGKIFSVDKKKDKRLKEIVAYDKIYELTTENLNSWLSSNGYLDTKYKGVWDGNILYSRDDIVWYSFGSYSNLDYGFWLCLNDVTGYNVPPSYGSSNWAKISNVSYLNTINVRNLMNDLALEFGSFLNITEIPQPTMPMDNYYTAIQLKENQYSFLDLFREYFNNNSVYGYFNPTTSDIDCRNINRRFAADSNYKGDWNEDSSYTMNDIVSYKEEEDSVYYYYKALSACSFINPNDEEYWERMPVLYSPNSRINYTHLYDYEGLDYKDYEVSFTGRNLIDENGKIVRGTFDKSNVSINEGLLKGIYNSDQDFWSVVNTPAINIVFTPTSMNAVGLPFVQPGDWITYDVEEYDPDTDTMIVKNKKTVILSRVLSGINALTDEIESRYE